MLKAVMDSTHEINGSPVVEKTSKININVSTENVKVEGITSESDPTVPAWAKTNSKPEYTAEEVGALPDTTEIPTRLAELQEDSLHQTVTAEEKQRWNDGGNTDYNNLINRPTMLSEFINDKGFIESESDPTVPAWAKESNKPTYTAIEVGALPNTTVIPSELSQLDSDETHRTVTDEEKAYWNAGSTNDYSNLSNTPTKLSEFENDNGFISAESDPTVPAWAKAPTKPSYEISEIQNLSALLELKASIGYVDEKIEGIISAGVDYKVVEELPESGAKGIIYLVPNGTDGSNIYDEYIWVNGSYEKIGSTEVDLSPYLKKNEINAVTNDDIDAMWEGEYINE